MLTHVAYYTRGNAGDAVLVAAVRSAIERVLGPQRWSSQHAHWPFEEAAMERANQTSGIIVGGGGLLLSDTNSRSVSGWQWPCATERYAGIEPPLAIFAVGYNQFRNQEAFAPRFDANLVSLVERADLVGLRNSGSIAAVRARLPEHLREGVRYQPCPTTVLRYLLDDVAPAPERTLVACNLALDRFDLRFGEGSEAILAGLRRALLELLDRGVAVELYSHIPEDDAAARLLGLEGTVPIRRLYGRPPHEVLAAYEGATVAVGMRGHAQMIPFGLGRPIVSLVSHDKLRWFLDDVGQPGWGLEVTDVDLSDRLPAMVGSAIDEYTTRVEAIHAAQARLWDITEANVVAFDRVRQAGRTSGSRA